MSAEALVVRAFDIDVPESELEELRHRVERTRWPDEPLDAGEELGVSLRYIRRLVEYWLSGYDWRKQEAALNALPQYRTRIDGEDLHFVHIRSPHDDAIPLILIHGWPSSFVEFAGLVPELGTPSIEGEPAFHVVIPSLPGFGFSGATTTRGWNVRRIARAFDALMMKLGYTRYAAAGNDMGSMVSAELAHAAADRLLGAHVCQVFSFPSGAPGELEELTADEQGQLEQLQWFQQHKAAFNVLMSQQPQTLAYAITDSPVGLLAWNAQLMADGLDQDFVLTNATIYWVTQTAASAARTYWENARMTPSTEATRVPIAVASFANDFSGIERFARRDHSNILRWTKFDRGGHFAAVDAPELLIGDLRSFFKSLA